MTVYKNQSVVKKLILFHKQNSNQKANNGGNGPVMVVENIPMMELPMRSSGFSSTSLPSTSRMYRVTGNFGNRLYEEKKVNDLATALDNIALHQPSATHENQGYF